MKKNILLFFASILCLACNSNDNALNAPSIDGSIFTRSSYVIETPVDGNGDGIFSNDLMQENFCFDLQLNFGASQTTSNPTHDLFLLRINTDLSGDLSQFASCSHFDGTPMVFNQIDDTVEFSYNGDVKFTGILSSDGNTLTFNFSNDLLWAFNFNIPDNQILNQDGSITGYDGDAIVTYTRL
jgi:hypothetical protein